MARIGLNTSISGLSGELIIRWVKATAPLAEVGRLAKGAFPYDGVDNLLDLDPVVYIVQWWRSDNGVSLDQLIKDWSIDASIYNETTIRTYQYVVDRGDGDSGVWADPVNLDTILIDTRLDGATKDDLLVHEAGYGNKIDAEYELVAGGGIELADGATFNADTRWFITRTQTVAQQIGPSEGSSSKYAGVAVLAANRDFYVDPTDNLYNKLVLSNWATTVGTVVFGALALIPDNTHVTFQTESGMQNYLRLQFNPGDTVRYLNKDVNVIDLPKCESISLFFFGGVCYVTDTPKRALLRGQVIPSFDSTLAVDSAAVLPAAEATGLLNGSDYPGIYAWLLDNATGKVALGAGVGQWSYDSGGGVYPNKRFYGIDVGAGTFRVPHLDGVTAKFGALPGTYEADAVGPFNIQIREGSGGSSTGPIENKGFSGQDNAAGWINNGLAGAEKYIRPTAGSPQETRVKGFLQIPYIIL